MSTRKRSGQADFWLVVFGLFLLIGFVAGGVYILDSHGFISAGGDMPQGGPPAEMLEGDSVDGMAADVLSEDYEEAAANTPPAREHGEEASGISAQSLVGILNVLAQLGLVVLVVAGGRWFYARLAALRSRTKTA